MRLISELKRRNVFRVGLFYIVSSWLLLQIADLVFELLLVPDWTLRFIFGALLVAFPFALFLAWAYELTPEGLKREREVDRSRSITNTTARKLDIAVIVVVILGILVVAADRLVDSPDEVPEVAEVETPAGGFEGDADQSRSAGETPSAGFEGGRAASRSVPGGRTAEETLPSVAVLPFTNMSPDPDQEYFSDGLADTLIHVLAQIDGLKVAARTSSFAFKGQQVDVREIAQKLGVAHVLEGSVQKAGNRLRIIAQLIDASDGTHLWSTTFDRSADDIFAIQDEIATEVVTALKGSLLAGDSARLTERYQPSLEGYRAFLQGRQLMAQRTSDGLRQAKKRFEEALEHDPNYPLAMVNLGDVHVLLFDYAGLDWDIAKANALPLYERALAINPDLGEAYVSLGSLTGRDGDREAALELMEKGISLSPSYATGYHWYSGTLQNLGRHDEALRMILKAAELDPLSDVIRANVDYALMESGHVDEALRSAEQSVLLNPDFPPHYGTLAWLADEEADLGRAIYWAREQARRDPGNLGTQWIACWWLANLPDLERALNCMAKIKEDFPDPQQHGTSQVAALVLEGRVDDAISLGTRLAEGQDVTRSQPYAVTTFAYGLKGAYATVVERLLRAHPELETAGADGITQENWRRAIDLAFALRKTGEIEASRQYVEGLWPLVDSFRRFGPRGFGIADAQLHAVSGDDEQALAALDAAVSAGWTSPWRVQLMQDPIFESVRTRDEFGLILEKVRVNIEQAQAWLDAHPPLEDPVTEAKIRAIQDAPSPEA